MKNKDKAPGNGAPNKGYKKDARNRRSNKNNNKRARDEYSMKESRNANYVAQHNDPSWYVFSKEVADAAYTFPFVPFTGTPFELGDTAVSKICPPVFATVNIAPIGGDAKGINYVARKTFTELSAYNSKTTQYQPQDITIIILALGSVLEMWNYIARTYRWGVSFNMRNKAIPEAFMNACDMDYDDFKKSIALYNGRLLTIMNNINRIPWPMNFDWFKVCATTHVNMFVDDPTSPMAQYYLTRPDGYWTLDEAYNEQGSGLRYTKFNYPLHGEAAHTMDYWLDILDSMVEAINMSTTFNVVFADVLRYLETNTSVPKYHVSIEDLTTSPSAIFSPEWNLMLNNASMVVVNANDVSCDVDNNNIIFHRSILVNPVQSNSQIVNFLTPNPTLEERISALKYMVGSELSEQPGFYNWDTPLMTALSADPVTDMETLGLGDHVITEISLRNGTEGNLVITKVFNSNAWVPEDPDFDGVESEPATGTRQVAQVRTLCDISKFIAMPRIYFVKNNTVKRVMEVIDTFGDLNYYSVIDPDTLERAKYVNAISLFEMQGSK